MPRQQFNFTNLFKALAIGLFVLSAFLSFGKSANAAAGINKTINFQGKVVNKTAGTNVSNGTYPMVFTIYDKPTGGTSLWSESDGSVTVTDGIFRVALGAGTAFPAGMNFNQDGLFLDITFNSEQMGSRVQLTAVPYAFNAAQVAGLTVQDDSGNASTSGTLKVANVKTLTFSNTLNFSGTDGKALVLTNGLTVNGGNDGTLAFSGASKTFTVANTLTLSGTDGSTLNVGAGGTLGTGAFATIANYATLASPTFTGTVTIPTSFVLGSTTVTTTGTQLNYLNAATGTTGTTSQKLVFDTSPTLVTPNIGAATATSIALGTTPAAAGTLRLPNATYITARNAANSADVNLIEVDGSNLVAFGANLAATTFGGNLTISTHDIVTDTSTGTKFGTATSQKIAFYNSPPIVQPSGNALTALSNLGLISSPTLTSTNVGLGNVENTALSTWAGSTNLTTAGALTATSIALGTTPAAAGTLRLPNATYITARNAANSADINLIEVDGSNLVAFGANLAATTLGGNLTLSTHDIVTDTSTGTKFGTATSQKIGFYNATPIVQPSGNALTALSNLGLISSPTLTSTNVGLGNVENTALSTWAGSTNLTTAGALTATSIALGTTPAAAGTLRLPNATYITARNAANSADINLIKVDGSNLVAFGANTAAFTLGGSVTGNSQSITALSGLTINGGGTLDSATSGTLAIASTTNTTALTIGNSGATSGITFNIDTAANYILQKEGSAFVCSGTDKLTLDSSGHLICSTDSTGAGVNWWNQLGGVVSPSNINYDFALGATATSSALFSYTGIQNASHQTIASISGKLIVMPNNGFGNVGIGTNTPTYPLQVSGIGSFDFLKNNVDAWATMAPVPTAVGGGGSAVYTGGDSIYLGNASGFYRYSISNDTWTDTASTNPPTFAAGGSMVYTGGDFIYAIAGGTTTQFARYQISTNTWVLSSTAPGTVAVLPTNAANGSTMVYTGGDYIYATQGTPGAGTAFWRYSISTNTWNTTVAQLLSAVASGFTMTYTGGNYIYATRGNISATFWRYDIAADYWKAMTAAPETFASGTSAVYTGGDYIYVLRGNGGSNSTLDRYSISSDSWLATPLSAPINANNGATLVKAGPYIYAPWANGTTAFYRYTPGGDSAFATNTGVTLRGAINGETNFGIFGTGAQTGKAMVRLNETGDQAILTASDSGVTKFTLDGTGTNPTASISGQTSYAALVVNNSGTGALMTASSSGLTRFVMNNNGSTAFEGDTLVSIGNGANGNNGSNAASNMIGDSGSMIPNAGFESAVVSTIADGWFPSSTSSAAFSRETTQIAKGTASVKALFTNSTVAINSTCIPLSGAVGAYTLNYYVKGVAPLAAVQGQLQGFTSKANCQSGTSPTIANAMVKAATAAWVRNGSSTTAMGSIGATATWARVSFNIVCASSCTSSTTYIDGVRLTESTTGQGLDYAENYTGDPNNLAQPGDVVMVKTINGITKVVPADKYGGTNAIGVVSTNPGLVLDDGNVDEPRIPVALSGRIPTKVSTANGSINVGDPLTSSNIPGVAVKATKAGNIIGTAMESYYDDNGPGQNGVITMFIKNSYFAGLFDESNSQNVDSQSILASLKSQNVTDISGLTSTISTDRILSSIEIISPKITTDTLFAKTIKAEKIEGLEIFTNKISKLDDNVASLNALFAANTSASPSGDVLGASDSASAISPSPTSLSVSSLDVEGLATISASLRVKGNSLVEGILNVVDTMVSNNVIVNGLANFFGDVVFKANVAFEGQPTFNKDTGGFAVIKKGADRVDVAFEKEYGNAPVVSVNLAFDELKNPDGTITDTKDLENKLFSQGYNFAVINKSTKGFTIVLNKKALDDLNFSWIALSIKDSKISVSQDILNLSSGSSLSATDSAGKGGE